MMRIYLTRHGETVDNAAGILQGQSPGCLNETGREQARMMRDKMAGFPFDALVSSDLQRAVDTAVILNEPHRLPLFQTALLRERDWGTLTGRKISSLRIKPADFPRNVENPAALQIRARLFLHYLLEHFDGQTVLAMGHGYFNRCILAEVLKKVPHDIPRWQNMEIRPFSIENCPDGGMQEFRDDAVSAD